MGVTGRAMAVAAASGLFLIPWSPAHAAASAGYAAADLSPLWGVPFAGMLLSIALMPLLANRFWHHHYGKVALFWALAFIVPFAIAYGPSVTAHELVHAALSEYIPFIILLGALFTVSGGILVAGHIHGGPGTNTLILALGTVMASFIGTTGASMVLIRPLLRANEGRKHVVHTVVFFIFLVSNIGGALTPLGDPPLFLGFLKGVSFFWTTTHLFTDTVLVAGILLVAYFLLELYFYRRETNLPARPDPSDETRIDIRGLQNVPLLFAIIGAILLSALWKPGISFDIYGTRVELQWIVRDVLLIVIALISVAITPRLVRERNGFDWEPILEVGKLFAAIFATIIPVIAILKAGSNGAFAPLVDLVTGPDGKPVNIAYFWLTGGLSAFLDNAPTYLVFFNLAGGDPHRLMGSLAVTLEAISAGAVFMGAMTYIGNAPNFMVVSIARHRGVKMPSFFGYMVWSSIFLLPCFALISWLYFV
ncbi:sodium:proton antiporter [Azorhizobium oxalatiphilum]|uniref:Sodium:proton antiporter n=1 Tax=Azorhizobium oxalatiphilum TaxID=980631 RepID=A0A917FGI0_9HYPH|nr:sodium:proton antiporter [Azorhizobium oxalatiphilum]GGF77157.1 sodium:proton antiporter [Azorhizobium oxalatiphilum]